MPKAVVYLAWEKGDDVYIIKEGSVVFSQSNSAQADEPMYIAPEGACTALQPALGFRRLPRFLAVSVFQSLPGTSALISAGVVVRWRWWWWRWWWWRW